jgi:hypothetical protein
MADFSGYASVQMGLLRNRSQGREKPGEVRGPLPDSCPDSWEARW